MSIFSLFNKQYLPLRDWQDVSYSTLSNKQYGMLNAPPGAGKSFVVSALSWEFYSNNSNKARSKVIVAVPQKKIGDSFKHNKVRVGKNYVDFIPFKHNMLTRSFDEANSVNEGALKQRMLRFLDNDNSCFEDSLLICCHRTLLNCVNEFPDKFSNVLIVGDEFHHSKIEYNENTNENESNEFGKAIEILAADKSNHILMVTATPFRNDAANIFPKGLSVVTYRLKFSEYLRQCCKYLKSYKYNHFVYEFANTYHNTLKDLFSKGIQRSIVFIPDPNSKESNGRDVDVIMTVSAALGIHYRDENGNIILLDDVKHPKNSNYERINSSEEVWEYKHKLTGKILRVVDLNDDNSIRDARHDYLDKVNNDPGNAEYLIIALKCFREGCDFKCLNRSIVLGKINSLNQMIQIWGRAGRDFPGKSVADLVQFFAINVDDDSKSAAKMGESKMIDIIAALESDIMQAKIIESEVNPKQSEEVDGGNPKEKSSFDKTTILNITNNILNKFKSNWLKVTACGIAGSAIFMFFSWCFSN
jgi:superfamily II DNA or RNA helicase